MEKFVEILKNSGREEFECPDELLLELMQTSRSKGNGRSAVQKEILFRIFVWATKAFGKIPAVVLQDGEILIHGKFVEGTEWTLLKKQIVAHLIKNGEASNYELAESVWGNVEISGSTIRSTITALRRLLLKYDCTIKINTKNRKYFLKF